MLRPSLRGWLAGVLMALAARLEIEEPLRFVEDNYAVTIPDADAWRIARRG